MSKELNSPSVADFLLELQSEEIPARFQQHGCDELSRLALKALLAAGLTHGTLKTFVTPRRLTLWVRDIPTTKPGYTQDIKGPKVGAPEAALQGFQQKTGLPLKDCVQIETPKGLFWFARVTHGPLETCDVLPSVVTSILEKFSWPAAMRWGASRFSWVRPLHGIMALFDQKVVPFTFDLAEKKDRGSMTEDTMQLCGSDQTHGHRFVENRTFKPQCFRSYEEGLHSRCVVLCAEKRGQIIREGLEALGRQHNWDLVSEDMCEKGLLGEVCGLVEWPRVLYVPLENAGAGLPFDIIRSVVKKHMKGFVFRKKTSAQDIAPAMGIVANIPAGIATDTLVKGLQRGAVARLADAHFFWESDQKISLKDHVPKLEGRLFFEGLGSFLDKTHRLVDLVKALWPNDPQKALLEEAAYLCKADLATHMVQEFPELQGTVGGLYAARQGVYQVIVKGIQHHYWPQGGIDDAKPVTLSSYSGMLGIADRLDNLYGLFSKGLRPSGSKDPLALKRMGNGVIHIMAAMACVPSLALWHQALRGAYQKQRFLLEDKEDSWHDVQAFLEERALFVLEKEKGIAKQCVLFSLSAPGLCANHLSERIAYACLMQPLWADGTLAKMASVLQRVQGLKAGLQKAATEDADISQGDHSMPGAVTTEDDLYKSIVGLHVPAKGTAQILYGFIKTLARVMLLAETFVDKEKIVVQEMRLNKKRLYMFKKLEACALQVGLWSAI